MANNETQSILVVGGGMSGMTAAIEAAEAGYDVYIVEKNPYLGGRVAQLHHYFPKLCPPYCGLEINFRRMRNNPRIRFFTLAEVDKVSGTEGNFEVSLKLNPRFVNENCTCCGKCAEVCSMEIDHELAFPMRYVIDPALAKSDEARKIKDACAYDAVEPDMGVKTVDLKVGSIVWASGWKPYDANKLETYGFGNFPDVITNVMMERLASYSGPTGGKILRPSDGEAPKTVAFVQCAGSRDENHLAFCSGICCLASMKQATYVREQYPDAKIFIFYIDIRATDRLEAFYWKVKEDENIEFFKGKVAKVTQDESGRGLILRVENTATEELNEIPADLVVLATGMEPNTADAPLPIEVPYDEYGFVASQNACPGVYAAGCTRTPNSVSEVVQDGTAAALKAIQSIARR